MTMKKRIQQGGLDVKTSSGASALIVDESSGAVSSGTSTISAAYHKVNGSVVGSRTGNFSNGMIFGGGSASILAANIYGDSVGVKATTTNTGYSFLQLTRVNVSSGNVFSLYSNYQDAQTADNANITTNESLIGTATASGAWTLGKTDGGSAHVVNGSLRATGPEYTGAVTNVSNFTNGKLAVSTTGGSTGAKAFVGLSENGGGGGCGFVFSRGSGYDTRVDVYTNSGSGNTAGSLNTAGPYVVAGGTSWTSSVSDERYKEDFIEIDDALSIIGQLRATHWKFKDSEDNKRHAGLIAQDLLSAGYPFAVEASNPDKLSITYDEIHSLYVKAIQELSTKLDATDAALQQANARIAALEAK